MRVAIFAFAIIFFAGLTPAAMGADRKVEATVECQFAVKARLKAPATAEFGDIMKTQMVFRDGKYTLLSHVDSENGYGANIRQRFLCELVEGAGGKLKVIDLTFE